MEALALPRMACCAVRLMCWGVVADVRTGVNYTIHESGEFTNTKEARVNDNALCM